MNVHIFVLGDFDFKRAGDSLLKKSKRAGKNLELLAYFITNKDKKLSSEHIIDTLWGESNHADPQNALRTQIFRLRRLLEESGLSGEGVPPEQALEISFENGFYVFTAGEHCRIDAVLFEQHVKAGDAAREENPGEALEEYIRAVSLYRGEYFEGYINSEWIFVIRNRFRRLYIQSVLRLLELLKQNGRWGEMVELFEYVVAFVPLEEALHLYYLEALLNLGEYKNAMSHYHYITGRIYKELAIQPSSALKSIYSRISSEEKNAVQTDICFLKNNILCDEQSGALFCDLEHFKLIYHVEERKSGRGGAGSFVGLLTLSCKDGNGRNGRFEAAGESLKHLLRRSLRQGDVFTQWNRSQIIVLLTGAESESLETICRRIGKKFSCEKESAGMDISFSFEPIAKNVLVSERE